jgi:hypothetical protein
VRARKGKRPPHRVDDAGGQGVVEVGNGTPLSLPDTQGKFRIADIRIGKRHRKDVGDISGLAASMGEIGLLHPVVIRPDGTLIAGARRLAACKSLGWKEVPVNVVPIDDIVLGEYAENAYRKDFLPSEIDAIRREIEPVEKTAAQERQKATQFGGAGKLPAPEKGRARDKIGTAVGISGKSVDKIAFVMDAARKAPAKFGPIAEQMDASGNIDRAYLAVVHQRRNDERNAQFRKLAAIDPRLHVGDFRELSPKHIPDNSVELVFTDPPYDRDSIPLYADAAKEAARVLKPGGSLVAYCGQIILPDVLPLMMQHLRYWWIGTDVHKGGGSTLGRMDKNGIIVGALPLLWFVKDYRADSHRFILDTVFTPREKDVHVWQKPLMSAEHYIKGLTSENGVVVDFFAGGGTTIVAAQNLGRQWVAFEKDTTAIPAIVERIKRKAEAAA